MVLVTMRLNDPPYSDIRHLNLDVLPRVGETILLPGGDTILGVVEPYPTRWRVLGIEHVCVSGHEDNGIRVSNQHSIRILVEFCH